MFTTYFLKKIYIYISSAILEALFPSNTSQNKLRDIPIGKLSHFLKPSPATPINHSYSLFAYKDHLTKHFIWNIKYKKNMYMIEHGAYELYKAIEKNTILKEIFRLTDNEKIILIPIPINAKRRKERGFNQTELIVNQMKNLDDGDRFIILENLLIRPNNNTHQTKQNRKGRLNSAKNIFDIDRDRYKELIFQNPEILNYKIIIIDDVITTGSTVLSAMNKLLEIKDRDIYALSIAH